jgi:hypothetical protein
MSDPTAPKAPRTHVPRSIRVGAFLLSVLLTLLLVWLLGFVLRDIARLEGPDYSAVRADYVDADLVERADGLRQEISAIERRVERQSELQADLQRSMDNARETMQQMMDLQRLALERQSPPSDEEKQALAVAQQRFLEAQDRFEAANAEIAASNETRFRLRQELLSTQEAIEGQEEPAREQYRELSRAHAFRVASLQLAFIVPLFLLAAWMFWRWRRSAYRSILLALLAASFWKLGTVMFEHFPREFFKYIAIAAAIATVLLFLAWLLRKAVRPGRDVLLARYREAYRAHLCPVCAYPITRGPLRFALWTRKGPRVAAAAAEAPGGQEPAPETPYACPSCGTTLYSACRRCEAPRHTLLPFCERCGDELPVGAEA